MASLIKAASDRHRPIWLMSAGSCLPLRAELRTVHESARLRELARSGVEGDLLFDPDLRLLAESWITRKSAEYP
jgi:hypothetical protein